jgi:osmoprotectant transport system permease protein
VLLLGSLGFENAYAFAMRGDDARRRGIRTLTDLASQAPDLAFATDVEFLERSEWKGVQRAYGMRFRSAHPY